jgi:hypothetical protein
MFVAPCKAHKTPMRSGWSIGVKVAIWLEECRELASDLTNAWDLDSLLVKPVQRILKYPLINDFTHKIRPSFYFVDTHRYVCSSLQSTQNADAVGMVLSRAFGRRTENPRQQVGVSNIFEDKDYEALTRRFVIGLDHFGNPFHCGDQLIEPSHGIFRFFYILLHRNT